MSNKNKKSKSSKRDGYSNEPSDTNKKFKKTRFNNDRENKHTQQNMFIEDNWK